MQSPQQGPLLAQVKSSSTWFYWIAGLSIFRAFMNVSSHQASISFYSMGVTNLLSTSTVGLVVALVICGLVIVLGAVAGQGKKWAFITGIVLYTLDALLLLLLGVFGGGTFSFVAVAFHGYVIYRLFLGVQACNQLGAAQMQASSPGYYGGAPAQPGAWPPPPGQAPPPQFGQAPYGQAPPPGAYPAPASYPPPAQPVPAQPYGQSLDGSSTEAPASDWSQPAQSQPLPSHWPAPAQPAPSRPAPETDQTPS